MAEVQNQSALTAASCSPRPTNSADRLVPEPRGCLDPDGGGGGGVGSCGGGGGNNNNNNNNNGEAHSGYADCDGTHVVNLSEYNVCVQMGGHALIAQQSQGERTGRTSRPNPWPAMYSQRCPFGSFW